MNVIFSWKGGCAMLCQFKVKNFKNFKEEFVFDLDSVKNYEFSLQAVKDGLVKTALIYGENGSGKTNLGYALFDIIVHLTDKERDAFDYRLYDNLQNRKKNRTGFSYCFRFGNDEVRYDYEKIGFQDLVKEQLIINGKEVAFYDHQKHIARLELKGAENLKLNLSSTPISFIKYIYSNTVLENNSINNVFDRFYNFVSNMLMFSSLERNNYQGFKSGSESISERIIKENKVKDFEHFLKAVGISYELEAREMDGSPKIFCKFGQRSVDFFAIASRGTCSLALFYYWLIQMDRASLVFIDEFDAFYHNRLAEQVVREVLDLENTQAILTTHNTDIMTNDLLRPDCYFNIIDGKIESFAQRTEKELRKAHNLQKMYKAGAFHE